MTEYLFTYGTLMSGERNHWRMRGQTLLCPARTKDPYYLFDRERYPVMLRKWQGYAILSIVHGELYKVDQDNLKMNDRFEGCPHFYTREEIPVVTQDNEIIFAWCYFGTRNIFEIHKELPKRPITTRWVSLHEERKTRKPKLVT